MRQYVLIAAVALAALVVVAVLFVLVRALLRARHRQTEKGELRRDLMLWRNLSSLVWGGDEARRAKADLSTRIGHVRELFALGLRLKREQHGDRDLPWFLVVGEPNSGKTTMLANAGLEFHSPVRSDSAEKQSLMPWVGPFAYGIDVGGRVFFDRWLEGSGAEWDETIALVARARHSRPLDGVVLCVPADALLVDETTLTREKTSLVSAELHRLVMRLGVNVPVHVVVTKCDMLLGWREAFAALSEAERAEPFGWRHGDPEAAFDAAEFGAWWRGAVEGLKARVVAHLADGEADGVRADRLSVSSRAYLLPDSFDALKANLESYLSHVFGAESWHGCDHLLLTGVFFTSAADTGTVLSREYAEFAGMKTEERPLVSEGVETYGGQFIRRLLHDFVAGCRIPATFTERTRFRRQVPGYLFAALLVVAGVYWLMMAFGTGGGLAARLEPATEFYRGVAKHFEQDDFVESPLFETDEGGAVRFLEHETMQSDPGVTRIRYLYLARSFVPESVEIGSGWWLASMLRFNFDGGMGGSMRRAIYNVIQSQMAFEPVVRCFERHENARRGEVFDSARRAAFGSYNDIAAFPGKEEVACVDIGNFITYLMPEINPDVLQLLRSFFPEDGQNWRARAATLAYDLDYVRTERRLYGDFFRAWSDLTIYPETSYPVVRGLITNSVAFLRDNGSVGEMAAAVAAGGSTNALVLARWRETLRRQVTRARHVAAGFASSSRLEAMMDSDPIGPKADAGANEEDVVRVPVVIRDPVRESIDEYRSLLSRDRRTLAKDIAVSLSLFSGHAAHAYYKTLGSHQLDARFDEIGRHLDAEAAAIQADVVELRAGGMMRQLRDRPKDGAAGAMESDARAYVFDIQAALYEAAVRSFSDDHVKSPEDLGPLLEREAARSAAAGESFTAAAGRWAADPSVAPLVKSLRRLMSAQSDENRLRLLREYVGVHPRTEREIGEFAAALSKDAADDAVLAPIADVVGEVPRVPQYAHDGVRTVLSAYAQIHALMHPNVPGKGDAKGAPAAVPLPDVPDYAKLESAMDGFVDGYVSYLARRIDGLSAKFGSTWADFRAQCAKIKPYAVNAVLQSGYVHVRDELKAIPDSALSPEARKRRDAALAVVEGRLKLLTPDFSATCARQAASWSLLSQDPVLAAKHLREAPAKTLMNDYLAVMGAEEKSRIPWWDTFFSRGLALAQAEALVKGVASLRKEGCKYLRFPLCRDPVVTDEILTDEGLSHANDALLSCGCALPAVEGENETPKTAGKPAPEADESAHPVLKRVRSTAVLTDANGSSRRPPVDLNRGAMMLQLIDSLTVHKFQTVWTLSVPPLAERLELQRRHFPALPLSTVRFRYGEVTVGGKRRGDPATLDATESVVLARGDLGDFDLRIRLKEFSDSPDFSVELDYSGPWTILRPYFAEGVVVVEKDKSVRIPLVAVDRHGLKSVFWVSISFTRPVPTPDDWPSTSHWIDTAAPRTGNRPGSASGSPQAGK